jgi:hypothetical protein
MVDHTVAIRLAKGGRRGIFRAQATQKSNADRCVATPSFSGWRSPLG